MNLTKRAIYYLIGYLDEKCMVPFMQTLIYLGSTAGEPTEHRFADAIAWYRDGQDEARLADEDTLLIANSDLDTIKDLGGLLEELRERASE